MAERFRTRVFDLRETEILTVAEDHLAKSGCHQLSVDKVASDAGVAKGTVYLHFSDRETLIRRALANAATRACALLAGILQADSGTDPVAPIESFVKASLDLASSTAHSGARQQLRYPCCSCFLKCPFEEEDCVQPTIARSVERAAALTGSTSLDSLDSGALLRSARFLLLDTFAIARNSSAAQAETLAAGVGQLLRRLLEVPAAER